MAATYDPSLVADKDWVRLLSGDRDMTDPRLQDEEIEQLLVENRNKYLAAAAACELILMRHGNLVEKQVGDLKIKYSDEVKSAYREYIARLRAKGADKLQAPGAGKQTVFRTVQR